MWPVGYNGIIIAWFATEESARAYAAERTENTPYQHKVLDKRAV